MRTHSSSVPTLWNEEMKRIREILGKQFSYEEIGADAISPVTNIYNTNVVEDFCSDCILCESACPCLRFSKERKVMTLNEVACKGCGVCVPMCPTSALQQKNLGYGYIDSTIHEMLSAPSAEVPQTCNYCTQRIGELTHVSEKNAVNIRLMCSGRIEASSILESLANGFDGVHVLGCFYKDFRFDVNAISVKKKVEVAKQTMALLGLDSERLRLSMQSVYEPAIAEGLSAFNSELLKKMDARTVADIGTPGRMQGKLQISDLISGTGANYCLECGKCTSICPPAGVNKQFSPRLIVKRMLLDSEDEIAGDKNLWTCLTCGSCTEFCPSKVKFHEFIRAARSEVHGYQNYGISAHGGTLQTIWKLMTGRKVKQNRMGWVTEDLRLSNHSDWLYFVGCQPYFDVLFKDIGVSLSANVAANVVRILNMLDVKPVVLEDERCCGHDALWSGNTSLFAGLSALNTKMFRETGAKKILTSCPECCRTFKMDYPELPKDVEVFHIAEFLAERIDAGELKFDRAAIEGKRFAYQDPCRLGRHMGIYEEPRKVISAIPGMDFVELTNSRSQSVCCGTSNWKNCDYVSEDIRVKRLKEAPAVGANTIVTSCPKCQIHFRCTLSCKPDERGLPKDLEIMDIVTLAAKSLMG